ncbi:hypothetical protein MASR2M78_20360 [Treponema sp.]
MIEKSAEYLGRGLAMLIDLLNPERIIIGSIFVRSESLFREHIEEVIKKEALSLSRACCSIVSAQLGEELGDTAAFCVALDAQKRA